MFGPIGRHTRRVKKKKNQRRDKEMPKKHQKSKRQARSKSVKQKSRPKTCRFFFKRRFYFDSIVLTHFMVLCERGKPGNRRLTFIVKPQHVRVQFLGFSPSLLQFNERYCRVWAGMREINAVLSFLLRIVGWVRFCFSLRDKHRH